MSESTTADPDNGLQPPAETPAPAEAPADGTSEPAKPDEALQAREAALKARQERTDARWARMSARNIALAEQVEKLQRFVPKPDAGAQPTPEDFRAEVERAAAEKVRADAFTTDCNAVAKQGRGQYADFDDKLTQLWQHVGKFDPALIEAAMEAGDAHTLLYQLGSDPDEAERIAGLSPARMGAALAKLAKAAPPPAQSRAPPPARPLNGGGGNPDARPDGDAAEFDRWYARQLKAKGR